MTAVAGGSAFAEEAGAEQPDMEVSDSLSYEAFLKAHENDARPSGSIPVDIAAFSSEGGEFKTQEGYLGKPGLSVYTDEDGSITFHVTVPAAGLYGLQLDFVSENKRGASVERKIKINGEYPHKEAESLVFNRLYRDDPDGKGKTDVQGNDIRPSQLEVKQWQDDGFIRDSQGYYITPLLFYFKEGDNTITFEATSEPLTIANLRLANEEARPSYAELQETYRQQGYTAAGTAPIIIQWEDAALKSDPVLYPVTDKTTPTTVPYEKNKQKLNAIGSEFKGRKVLLVDDSIVRGTTSKEIVQMARDAGAVKVYLASAAPPVRHPNVYGIDMPTRAELVAHGRTVEEIRQVIGADALIYQDVAAMKQTVGKINPQVQGFEASCFDGVYITGDISEDEVTALNEGRNRGGEEEASDASRLSLPNAQEA